MPLPKILAGAKLPKLEKLTGIQETIEKGYAKHEAVLTEASTYADQAAAVAGEFMKAPSLEKLMKIVHLDLERQVIYKVILSFRENIHALKDQAMAKNAPLLREAYAEIRDVIAERRQAITKDDFERSARFDIDHVSEELFARLDQMERGLNDGSPHIDSRFHVAWGALRSAATEHAKPRRVYADALSHAPDAADERAYALNGGRGGSTRPMSHTGRSAVVAGAGTSAASGRVGV